MTAEGYDDFTALMQSRGMPEGAPAVLTLSTCGDEGGSTRVVVHAASIW